MRENNVKFGQQFEEGQQQIKTFGILWIRLIYQIKTNYYVAHKFFPIQMI